MKAMEILNLISVLSLSMTAVIVVFLVFRISRDQYEEGEAKRINLLKEMLIGKEVTTDKGEIYKVIVISSTSSLISDIEKEGVKIILLEEIIGGIPESWLKTFREVKNKCWFKPRFVYCIK